MPRIACLLNVLMCLRAFAPLLLTCLSFLTCLTCLQFLMRLHYLTYLHFLYVLLLFLQILMFFIFLRWIQFLRVLYAFIFNNLHFLRTFFFLRAYTLFTRFRFSYIPSCFLLVFLFVKCFKFFAYLPCLHFFTCLTLLQFSSQMPNKGGKGGIGWFFYFSQLLRRPLEL